MNWHFISQNYIIQNESLPNHPFGNWRPKQQTGNWLLCDWPLRLIRKACLGDTMLIWARLGAAFRARFLMPLSGSWPCSAANSG